MINNRFNVVYHLLGFVINLFYLCKKYKNMEIDWDLPEILKPEFRDLERRLNKSCKWVEEHSNEIHPSISFIQAIELYDMGIDVTQLKPKQIND